MRRSVCYAEPSTVLAGERNTWKFIITPSMSLPKGTVVQFDLDTKNRAMDWEIPRAFSADQSNIIWAQIEDGKEISAKEVFGKETSGPLFEFILPKEIPVGKSLFVFMGTPLVGKEREKGNQSQLVIQRRRTFFVSIDTTGKRHFNEPEPISLDVRGNVLSIIRVIAPSIVAKNKRFDVVLRFEDAFGNLTNNAPEETLIEISHDNLRDNLKWKLFVPETGFIALPNLYFNDIGTYFIYLKDTFSKKEYVSSPIKCFPTESLSIFWGSFHNESERYDAKDSIESCLRHFRDEKSYNFYATSAADAEAETSSDDWKKISHQVNDFNEDDRFCAILGQQYSGDPCIEGERILLYAKQDKPLLRKKETRTSTLKKVYGLFSPKDLIAVLTATTSPEHGFNFEEFSPEIERLAEIYTAWGCSERLLKEKNPFPSCEKEYAEGSLLRALKKNCRFGFVAGGLDDRGIYAPYYSSKIKQYPPGLTGVFADRLQRQTIFEALYQRHTFATTGPRIIAYFSVAGHCMGSELSTATKPGLLVCRHISGYVSGTAPLQKIELIRNGEVCTTFQTAKKYIDFTYDDMEPLQSISLKDSTPGAPAFIFYYIRVTQEDGHMAWVSPVWIDCISIPSKKAVLKKTVQMKEPL